MSRRDPRGSTRVGVAVALALLIAVGALWAVLLFGDGRAGGAPAATRTAASSSTTATPSATSSSAQVGAWSMADARAALDSGDARVLVLGDGTGDHPEEWAHQWARSRDLPVASWQVESEDGYASQSADTRMWSGSMPGATADYLGEHAEAMWPAQDPDLVILNYGHAFGSPAQATTSMEGLRADLAERVPQAPIVVILQNPRADDANADTREAIGEWAQGAGLPTIDAAQAFEDSSLLPADLRLDDFHPSIAGTEIWVDTVDAALTV